MARLARASAGLDQAGYSGGSLQMADVRLYGPIAQDLLIPLLCDSSSPMR